MKTHQKYLGDMGIENFDSVEEIKEYFSRDNLVSMFGPDQYDEAEAEEALSDALDSFDQLPAAYTIVNSSNMVLCEGGFVCSASIDDGCHYTLDQLKTLDYDDEINPDNWFHNSDDDMGWGTEDGTIFALASEVK